MEGLRLRVNGLIKAGVVVVAESRAAALFMYHIYTGILLVITLAA